MESIWLKPHRVFGDLREFLSFLESRGELKRIDAPVSPKLEITEISRRVLEQRGPALLFTNASDRGIPVLANLFGTEERVAAALGFDGTETLGDLGRLLAALRAPQPPRSIGEAWRALPLLKEILNMAPRTVRSARVPRGARRRPRRGPLGMADPDLLARRRRAADHLGAHDDARPRSRPAEPRHLSAASDRPQQGDHALARAPRRRDGLPRVPGQAPGRAISRWP